VQKLKNRLKKWEEMVDKEIRSKPERKSVFQTDSLINVKRIYTPLDSDDSSYLEKLSFPGVHPFTRGIYPTMYRGRLWTMRQYAGFGSCEETNKRFKYLLEQGQTGLSVAFDLPTQMGYDSDNPLSQGEVGRVGVAIDSIEDMEKLFDGIPLDRVTTSMTINATASILLAMYIVVGEKQGVQPSKLRGTIQNDILKEYIARGTYIFPPEPSMRIITDIFSYCKDNLPNFNTISISGYHIREAGATALQEIAFTLADGIEYVKSALKSGLDIDDFAPRLSFFFNVHNNLFEEIAKFRAARRLWADIMKNKFKAKKDESMRLRFHSQTAGSTLTAQQVENNIVRVTLQALAAVLGGTQSLHTNSMDEALGLPTEDSVRIALRTQQIIANETGVTDTVDPLGGGYFIESLTDNLYKESKRYIERIEEMGGMLKAIESGYVQKEIQDSAYRYQVEIEKKEKIIVGLNEYKIKETTRENRFLRVSPEIENKQKENLISLKKKRDNSKVELLLKEVENTARENTNLMPAIIKAVRGYATIGEITSALERVFTRYRSPQWL